ncbi:hypothetical protein BESB_062810 [Besnoitia besnoiti]|uniref:MORN repeat-containing protein n=1 Tax=Besnoitia besnoiti TaxID=94643 RepID=A0A2A9MDX6_BESBE|nr:hypothetical protein BESB_062810 [Besnoitia besnoiti]PFH35394.1 hypothetical protein BESB_062810 [Besnoitia besnoiti]
MTSECRAPRTRGAQGEVTPRRSSSSRWRGRCPGEKPEGTQPAAPSSEQINSKRQSMEGSCPCGVRLPASFSCPPLVIATCLLVFLASSALPTLPLNGEAERGVRPPIPAVPHFPRANAWELFSSSAATPPPSAGWIPFFPSKPSSTAENDARGASASSLPWWHVRQSATDKKKEKEHEEEAAAPFLLSWARRSFSAPADLPTPQTKGETAEKDAHAEKLAPKYFASSEKGKARAETETLFDDVPSTPAGFFFFANSRDTSGDVNCSVEPANFPADARDFVVQCPASVQTAEILLLTKKKNRKFALTGSTKSASTVSLRFAASVLDAREVSVDVCDEDADPNIAAAAAASDASASLLSVFGSLTQHKGPETFSSDARAKSLAPFLSPPNLPVSPSAACRTVTLLPVHLPSHGSNAPPRLAQLALSRGVQGLPSLQPDFDPEIAEYQATVPEAQSVTVAAAAAPGFFIKVEEEDGSLPVPRSARSRNPLALLTEERKTSLLHRVTCGGPGSTIRLVLSVFSAHAGGPDLCSRNVRCTHSALTEKTLEEKKNAANGSGDPVQYQVYIHCAASRLGRAALAGVEPQRGQLFPRVFSPEKHLYYLRLPAGLNEDKVTFRAAEKHTEILVGDEGRRRSAGVAQSVPLWLAPDDQSKVIPVRTFVKKNGDKSLEEGEMYFIILTRGTDDSEDETLDGVVALLKDLNLLGATLNQPFDPRVFHYSAQLPHNRKFVGLQLGEEIPGSQIHVDGARVLPRHQTAFYRLQPGSTKHVSIAVSPPDSGTFAEDATPQQANGKNKRVVYTVDLTRPTPWFSGASIVPVLADVACWGSALVHAAAGAGWLAVSKTLNFVAITAAIPGTPEMWKSFSSRFFDFGLQIPLPAPWVEILDESPQGLAGPQMLPSASSPLAKVVPATLFGITAPPLATLGLGEKNWEGVSDALLRVLERESDRAELLSRFVSCVLLYASVLFVLLALFSRILVRRLFERWHGAALEASNALPRESEGARGPAQTRMKDLWRFLPAHIPIPSRVLIFILDYGLVSFAQASAGLAFAEKTISVRLLGLHLSPWALFAVCCVLLLYPVGYLLWAHSALRVLQKKVVFCSALGKFTDRRAYEVKARVMPSSFVPPALTELLSWYLRSVAPIKAPSVAASAAAGVALPLETEGDAAADSEDEEDSYHRSFACGQGLALTGKMKRQKEARCAGSLSALASPVAASLCRARDAIGTSCEGCPSSLASSALLPQCLRDANSPAEEEGELCVAAVQEAGVGDRQVDESGRPDDDEADEGACIIASDDRQEGPSSVVRDNQEILLQLDGDAYEVHGYEAANDLLAQKWPAASVGRVSVNLACVLPSAGSSACPSSSPEAACLTAEAEIQLRHLRSLSWLAGGLTRPLHFWSSPSNLQFSYADRVSLLLPSSCCAPCSLLHFLTLRGTLVASVLLIGLSTPGFAPGWVSSASASRVHFAALLLACGVNLAVSLGSTIRHSAEEWTRCERRGRSEGPPQTEAPPAPHEALLGDVGKTREVDGERAQDGEAAEDVRGQFVGVQQGCTRSAQRRELQAHWRLWKRWRRGEGAHPTLRLWTARLQPAVRRLLGHRVWRNKAVFVGTDLLCGGVGAELAKLGLLLVLLGANDEAGLAELHVGTTLAGACLVVLAVALPSRVAIAHSRAAWRLWLGHVKLQALVAMYRTAEIARNWRFYVHLTLFYIRQAAKWTYSILTANRRNAKPLSWRYPTAPVFINSEMELPVRKLHVVVPETGLLFEASAPRAVSPSAESRGLLTAFISALYGTKSAKAAALYFPLGSAEACDAPSPCFGAAAPVRKRLVCLDPVPRGSIEAQLPVQVDASRLLQSLQGATPGAPAGQLVVTVQVVHNPNYRYPLYDKAFSSFASVLALVEKTPTLAWLRNSLRMSRLLSSFSSLFSGTSSRAVADSYLSLRTDDTLIPPRGRGLRPSLRLSQDEASCAQREAPAALSLSSAFSIEKAPAVVRLDSVGGQIVLKIFADCIRISQTYTLVPVRKQTSGPTREKSDSQLIFADVAQCVTSGQLEVVLPPGVKPDLRDEVQVTRRAREGSGEGAWEFSIRPDEVAIQHDETLNRVLLKHRDLQRGRHYSTVFRSSAAVVPPPSCEVPATEKGRLVVPLETQAALPDLENFLLLLSADEQPAVVHVIDPAFTDAHVCFVPHMRPLSLAHEASEAPERPTRTEEGKRRVLRALRACRQAVWCALDGADRGDEEQSFLPPVPCTLLKELPGEDDETETESGGSFRVEPNYKPQRLVLAAAMHEREALLQDLLANGADALPTVAEAVLTPSELMVFFAERGIHTNGESKWINPLIEPQHAAVRKYSGRLVPARVALIHHLATRLDKDIHRLQTLVRDFEVLEKMQEDVVLRAAVQEYDDAIEMCKGIEELSFLSMRMENVRTQHYATSVLRGVPFPLELEAGAIAAKPRIAEQMRKWEEQLGLWLAGEVGAAPQGSGVGEGVGHLEAAVDGILQQAYKCMYSGVAGVSSSPAPVLHFVASSLTLCGGPSTWLPDPLPAHAAFVQLWEQLERDGGESGERAVWVPCFIKLTASALQFVFPHFLLASSASEISSSSVASCPVQAPERRVLPLHFVRHCELSVCVPTGLESDECDLPAASPWSGGEEEQTFPQLRLQKLRLQFGTVEEKEAARNSASASTRVFPTDYLALPLASGARKFAFFSSAADGNALLSVRTSMCHLVSWQTMLVGAEMTKPKQVIEGYEGKVRYVFPTSSPADESSASPLFSQLLFTDTEGELRARRGGALGYPRVFSSLPLPPSAFYKAPHASRLSTSSPDNSAGSSSRRTYVPLVSDDDESARTLHAARALERRQRAQFLEMQKKEREALASSCTIRLVPEHIVDENERKTTAGAGSRSSSSTPQSFSAPDTQLLLDAQPGQGAEGAADLLSGGTGDSAAGVLAAGMRNLGKDAPGNRGEQIFYDYATNPPTFAGKYIGAWSMGRFHGEGALFDQCERLVYQGEWKHGKRWGQGIAYSPDTNGTWWVQRGAFVADELEGPVRLTAMSGNADTGGELGISEIEGTVEAARPGATEETSCTPANSARSTEPHPSLPQERDAEYLPFRSRWPQLLGPARAEGSLTLLERLNKSFKRIQFSDGSEFIRAAGGDVAKDTVSGILRTAHFVYEGCFANGKAEGKGKIESLATGAVYDGEWRNGRRHGKGLLQLRHPNSDAKIVVTASFKDDSASCSSGKIDVERAPVGEEKEKKRSGDWLPFTSYAGGLEGGLPHGKGVMAFDTFIYEGDFNAGCREGRGIVKDIKKKGLIRVDGQWSADVPHGRVSRVVYADDSIYAGDFFEGKREGHGTLVRSNTVVYDGLWKEDVPDGRGTFILEEGTYEGEVQGGKRHGKGRFTFFGETTETGQPCVYEGDWQDDLPHGVGKYRGPSGGEHAYLFVRGQVDPNLKGKRASKGGGVVELPPVGEAPSITPNAAWWKAGASRLTRENLQRALNDPHTHFGEYRAKSFPFGVKPSEGASPGAALPPISCADGPGGPESGVVVRTPSGRRFS